MNFKSGFFRFNLALILMFLLASAVFADTIRLRDGSIIKGKIVGFGGGRFTVLITDGTRRRQMDFSAAEVESISFDAANVNSSPVGTVRNDGGSGQIAANTQTAPVQTAPSNAPSVPTQTARSTANTIPKSTAAASPITINASVFADNTSNGWTNSGFVVRKGQRIRIGGTGKISLGGGRYATPAGDAALTDASKLMATEATGGLIAVIGDDNNDFIFIGAGREFVAERDGSLFLGVNEGNLADNSGTFAAKIDIFPN